MMLAIYAVLLVATFITNSNVISARLIEPEIANSDRIYLIHDEKIDTTYENLPLIDKESIPIDEAEIAPMCAPSVTTVSGSHAPGGQICSQQLILNEDFNTFDMNLWRHEITMNGGGVSMHPSNSLSGTDVNFSELRVPNVYKQPSQLLRVEWDFAHTSNTHHRCYT